MKTRIFTLIIIAFITMPVSVNGQVTNYLKKKKNVAKKSATKTADKEVDKEINKAVSKGVLNLKNRLLKGKVGEVATEKTEEVKSGDTAGVSETDPVKADVTEKKAESKSRANPLAGFIGKSGGEIKHNDNYNFTASILMEMEVYDDNDEVADAVIEYVSYVNPGSVNAAIEIRPKMDGSTGQPGMTMIYDETNQCALMLTSQGSQKTAIVTKMDDMQEPGEDEEAVHATENPTYTKTGKTKSVAGYKCDGYVLQDGESTINMWVTKNLELMPGKRHMKKSGIPMYYDSPFEGGMIMEMEVYENDIKRMKMVIKEVNTNINKSFSLKEYMIMNMNLGGQK